MDVRNGNIENDSLQDLIDQAVEPVVWKKHLVKDLMKFWDCSEATDLCGDLFPTYRTNSGGRLPEDPKDWPEEFNEASHAEDTKGLIEPEYNFVRAHSRQTYAYGIAG